MSGHPKVVAYYKRTTAEVEEVFQVVVRADSSYPDALNEAQVNAVRGVDQMVVDTQAHYAAEETTAPPE